MRLHVLHETHYYYTTPAHALAMEARLQPCNDDYQSRQRYKLSVSPKTPIHEYTAFSDLPVFYWTMPKAGEVHVVSESVVDIRIRPLIPVEAPPQATHSLDLFPYIQPTRLTAATPELMEFANQFVQVARQDWYQTALAVSRAVYKTVSFSEGCTGVQTTAGEVLRLQCGVCQDYSHLMLATLRLLGIPARYVSGYLNQDTNQKPVHAGGISYPSMSQVMQPANAPREPIPNGPGEKSVQGTGASHAWVEVYLGPQGGWRGFDPTNNLLIDQNFVRIGAGRDFNDVTPVKGVHKGPTEERLEVHVSVRQVS